METINSALLPENDARLNWSIRSTGRYRVLLDDPAVDQERAPVQGVSGSGGQDTVAGLCCLRSKIVIEAAEYGQLGDLLIGQPQRA